MSTAIVKKERSAVAVYGEKDPFESFADEVSPQMICGKLLKFSKGDFLAGEDAELINEGTILTVGIDQMIVGWVRWEDNRPIEHRMVSIALNQFPPRRSELGN